MTWAKERLDALVRREATPPPVVETLRMGLLDDWSEGWARKRWEPDAGLLNVDGTVFGGYLAALADQMLTFACMSVLTNDEAMRTTDLQMRFFKLARGEPLIVEGRVLKRSRSLIHGEVDFRREDGDMIGRASGQMFVTPFPAERR